MTVAASPRSAGKTYEEAVGDRWKMKKPMPEGVKKLIIHNVNEVEEVASTVDFVFSAVDMTKRGRSRFLEFGRGIGPYCKMAKRDRERAQACYELSFK